MKILVLSNFYPPHYIGGYELGCRDVVDNLKSRGHEIKVLTSTHGVDGPQDDGQVYRLLHEYNGYCQWLGQRKQSNGIKWPVDIADLREFRSLCRAWKPDLVYVWNMGFLSVMPVLWAQNNGLPTCFFVSDQWLAQWRNDQWPLSWYTEKINQPRGSVYYWKRQLIRWYLRRVGVLKASPQFDVRHTHFVSRYLKDVTAKAGKAVQDGQVIYWGVDSEKFSDSRVPRLPRRLLFVGQVMPHKGVHTVIHAFKKIVDASGHKDLRLTIAGGSTTPHYEQEMHDLADSLGLQDQVQFTGLLPREELPRLYQEHDVLLFASIFDEPFSITVLEALSSGLAVVGTTTGGSGEILNHGENALVFPKEDASECAAQVLRLLEDNQLFERIRANGRRTILENHQLDAMIDKIEKSLSEITSASASKLSAT